MNRLILLMASMGRELIVADRCTLWLLSDDKRTLWTKVAHGLSKVEVPSDKGFVGHAVATGESLNIEDAYQDDRFNQEVDKQTGYRTKAVLVIPIRNQYGKIIGAYQAVNKRTELEKFSELDLKHLSLAASYSGKSLETAMLNQEIEETQKEIIFTMGEIGESRSKETGYHVKRVAEYSYIIARQIGLVEEEAELIKMASPMHDIGKVAIPDSILNKPGKLSDDEFKVMETHTTIGYNLLKKSERPILKAAAHIALDHHEKWNGKGYPNGKSGEDIHLYGRITAVADVFDALGSDRIYKKAWELDRILTLFKDERGEHFDPKIVDAFFNCLPEILSVRSMWKE
ncbi:HD domain-containing phosphohydrolase [Bacillaceae bacterium W0354]